MTEQRFIDPFSLPTEEEEKALLRQAAEEAYRKFHENNVGRKFGVRSIGVGSNKIYFYVRNKKYEKKLPTTFHGFECETKVIGNNPVTSTYEAY